MVKLEGIPLNLSGSQTLDELIPNQLYQNQLLFNWSANAYYDDQEQGPYSFANVLAGLNGGTLTSCYLQVGQLAFKENDESRWFLDVTFDSLITGDISTSETPSGGPGGGGGGKG